MCDRHSEKAVPAEPAEGIRRQGVTQQQELDRTVADGGRVTVSSPHEQSGIPSGRRRKVPWEPIGVIAAVAAVVATIIFSTLQLILPPGDQASGGGTGLPDDERLELVEVEFDPDPLPVILLERVPAGQELTVSPRPAASHPAQAESEERLRLVLTLRNPTDHPAVLTGLKLVVHETYHAPNCGVPSGGGVNPSLNYDYRFPAQLGGSWQETHPQNFVVPPRSVDSLSVTMGPRLSGNLGLVWRFSLFGVSKGGNEAAWAVGVSTDYPPGDNSLYIDHAWPQPRDSGSVEAVRGCAAEAAAHLRSYVDEAPDAAVIHPGVERMIQAYSELADYDA